MDKLRKSWMLYAVLVCAVVGLVYAGFKIVSGPNTQEQTAQGEVQSPSGTEREEQTPTIPPTQEPKETQTTQKPETAEPENQEPEENVPQGEDPQSTGTTQPIKQENQTSSTTTGTKQPTSTTPTQGTDLPNSGDEKKTEEPPVHIHNWNAWSYANDQEEERICSSCKSIETRPHSFALQDTIYQDTEDGLHKVTEKYACTTCQTAKYENSFSLPHQYGDGKESTEPNKDGTHTITTTWECKDCENVREEEKTEKCQFGSWLFDKKSLDVRQCSVCRYEETRKHQTTEQPGTNPSRPSWPGGGSDNEGVTHYHSWSEWTYQDDDKEARTCTSCGTKETRPHTFAKVSTASEDKQDGNHEVTEKYACTTCQQAKYENTFTEPHQYDSGTKNATAMVDGKHSVEATYTCTVCGNVRTDTSEEDCQYGEWRLGENNEDIRKCTLCTNEETRPHEHGPAPEGLNYVYQASNSDGTHRLEATYTCNMCGQEVVASQNEPCCYGDVSYEQTGVNDTHLVVQTCKVCQYRHEEEGTCEPTGELKLMKIYAQIYEYYDCALCGDDCLRKYHTEHRFEPWEDHGPDDHIRYCICVEARETAEHNFVKQDGMLVCQDCGKSVDISNHDHGHGVYDDMDLMDIIFSPAYGELITSNQIANPNPSSYSYCFRYDFRCSVCGIKYSVHQSHTFENGQCIGGYCGHIKEPQSEADPDDGAEEGTKTLDPATIPQVEALPKQEDLPEGEPLENGDGTEPENGLEPEGEPEKEAEPSEKSE